MNLSFFRYFCTKMRSRLPEFFWEFRENTCGGENLRIFLKNWSNEAFRKASKLVSEAFVIFLQKLRFEASKLREYFYGTQYKFLQEAVLNLRIFSSNIWFEENIRRFNKYLSPSKASFAGERRQEILLQGTVVPVPTEVVVVLVSSHEWKRAIITTAPGGGSSSSR